MPKRPRTQTITVHAVLPAADVEKLDRIADQDYFTTRSHLIARIINNWLKARDAPRVAEVVVTLDDGTEHRLTAR